MTDSTTMQAPVGTLIIQWSSAGGSSGEMKLRRLIFARRVSLPGDALWRT